ncbi:MAG: y4mF family transcriptional regulator [Verrucomicrobiales bacterium]|jgi:y4mF family transcriptional regulator
MNSHAIEIGSLLRDRRRHLGIRQIDFAALSQVAVHTVSDIESGKGNPTLDILLKILDPLGLELAVRPKIPTTAETVSLKTPKR